MAYTAEFSAVKGLDEATRARLVHLYLDHYESSNVARVLCDLSTKQEVLLLYHDKELVGFTTLEFYPFSWRGQTVHIVFSGDTVVDRGHWGQQTLAFRWIERIGQLKAEHPDQPLYWFLIVKGHRTYRYLPAFSKSFYPHWSIDRGDLKPLADALAEAKYGSNYNPATGVVEFAVSHGHLKPEIAFPTKEERAKPAVQFFLDRNPGYLEGHELVCLCEIEETNMKPLTRRLFRKISDDRVLAATG